MRRRMAALILLLAGLLSVHASPSPWQPGSDTMKPTKHATRIVLFLVLFSVGTLVFVQPPVSHAVGGATWTPTNQ